MTPAAALLAVLAAAPSPEVAALLERVDAAWAERDDPARLADAEAALARATELAPDEYGVLWREARRLAWLSDDPARPQKERSRLGRRGHEVAERAVALAPDRVEGHLFSALCIGNYALGIGVLKALREGVEGKFRARLSRAEQLQPDALAGTVPLAWGRFWYELPWPKYSARKSEDALRRALRMNPASVRARVYLAELYEKEGAHEPAVNLLQDAVDLRPGAYDGPEERRMQARAAALLAGLQGR
jgi:hypothetical protein